MRQPRIGLVLFLLLIPVAMCFALADPPRKRPPVVTEVEDPPSPRPVARPRVPIRDDEGVARVSRPPRYLPAGAVIDLAEEARKAEHPAIRKLLLDFAEPYDLIVWPTKTEYKIKPVARRFDPFDPNGTTALPLLERILDDGTIRPLPTIARSTILDFRQYEVRALAEVKQLLDSGLDKPAADRTPIPRFRLLQVGEMVLRVVWRYHVSARDGKLRTGDEWKPVEQKLREELEQVQLDQVRALTGEKDYASSLGLSRQLYNPNLPSTQVLQVIENVFVSQAQLALDKGEYTLARAQLDELRRDFPKAFTKPAEQVQDRLKERARKLVQEGKDLAVKGKEQADLKKPDEAGKLYSQARQKLDEAERIWSLSWSLVPDMAELGQMLRQHTVLRVGVRSLPSSKQLLPTTAQTDVERLAVRLIYEPLLKLRTGPSARDGYVFQLGPEQPRATADGWEFTLPRDVLWSDGEPLTLADVERSFKVHTDPRSPHFDPIAAETLKFQSDDPQRFTLSLARGCLDPFALMTFDLVPAKHYPADGSPRAPAAQTPVGTGPYVFKGIEKGIDGSECVFAANLHYRRPHAPEGPYFREIRLLEYSDFAQARQLLTAGKLHMILDLTSAEKEELAGTAGIDVLTPTEPPTDESRPHLSNPRVCFLAPNLRKPIFQNDKLRKGIALAIPREQILADVYRGPTRKHHRALNGPYPIGSWAYDSSLPADPTNTEEGGKLLDAAKKELGTLPALSLKYPADDGLAGRACDKIKAALQGKGIALSVEAVPRGQLAAEFAKERPEFDLVYWQHDFENETLSLAALLDPAGRNLPGLGRDQQLDPLFQELRLFRNFSYIQLRSRELHRVLNEKMVLIPLWQLDRHVAFGKGLRLNPGQRLHPLWAMDGAETWKMDR